MTHSKSMIDRQQAQTDPVLESLRNAARTTSSWAVTHKPAAAFILDQRTQSLERNLRQFMLELDKHTSTAQLEGNNSAVVTELRASARLLNATVNELTELPENVATLPRVRISAKKDEPRVAAIAKTFLSAVDGDYSSASLAAFIRELQTYDPLTLNELWSISSLLKLTLLESLLVRARALLLLPDTDADAPPLARAIQVRLNSLRAIDRTEWSTLVEPLILFDGILRQDPAGVYSSMEFDSRESYRRRIASIASRSNCTESEVAQIAIDLAREGLSQKICDPCIYRRHIHVGYFLLDKGFARLASRVGFHPRLVDRVRTYLRANPDDFYIAGTVVIAIVFTAALIFPQLPHITWQAFLRALLLLALPATQCAVNLMNNTVTAIFDAEPLPKIDFSGGISQECTTLVAVPTLLLNEKQVRGLVNDLEVRFIANRDPHLHFALLTDLPDSVTTPHADDRDPLVDLAARLIGELSAKYASEKDGAFILLHRQRIFNVRQGVWMGWERKRGKLLDLNKLLMGGFDAFPVKFGRLDVLRQVRYVLTLDSDTQLPRGSAARLIGAIAHPLQQAVIDPKRRIVVDGYGILQPRIGVSIRSASRSRLASIYSGQSGLDIYTRAISDAYQDLYGEGIFTGKGIYEVATLHAVLDRRFARDSLLSHDLIEGAYARAGLASDIELIDDYPSHLSAFNRRKHRWVRGDWQITQWMFSRVPDESGRMVPSPISPISRWKIFDNLRRSLVEPLTFFLFVAGWFWLPGGPVYWTAVSLALLLFPTLIQFAFSVGRTFIGGSKRSVSEALAGSWIAVFATFLNLVFLPYQTLLSLDAIVRSLVRRFITGERLLEWETAAQAEYRSKDRTSAVGLLILFVACGAALLLYAVNPHGQVFWAATPILLLWGSADAVTAWLNAPPRQQNLRLRSSDEEYLFAHSLRIWRYFRQFGQERHNYLIPDNVEEDGDYEAARVSPTNLGLLLNARQAACELGFLTAPEFVTLTSRSLDTIAQLQKYRGHLYNWYDTQTLAPLGEALFVSTVDSGNFVASLYTLHSGALAMLRKPLLSRQLLRGLTKHWQLIKQQGALPERIAQYALPEYAASLDVWVQWLHATDAALAATSDSLDAFEEGRHEGSWWRIETKHRIEAILDLLNHYMPWLLPEYADLRALPELGLLREVERTSIDDAAALSLTLEARLAEIRSKIPGDHPLQIAAQKLIASLPTAADNLRALTTHLREIASRSEGMAEATEFDFLIDSSQHLLSIGFDAQKERTHVSCYDMLASEARVATFLAIARGDIPQQSWFRLGRAHAHAFGRFLLLSWTGTMFEYLMPEIWMRSYPDTLISRTVSACVQVQRAFAGTLNTPWGISESGTARKDYAGHYQYKAYGVPQIALSVEADAGPVISPYSTFLALGVDSVASLRNLHRMEAAGWVGTYGFYEAADYAANSGTPDLVREWMAHHQGMSLLAILNILKENVVQTWFHANPLVQSTELLLHEVPASKTALRNVLDS